MSSMPIFASRSIIASGTLNSRGLFVLTHESRHVAVLRDQCRTYKDILNLIRSTFPAARNAPTEHIVIHATLPRYPAWQTELSEATWEVAFPEVEDVTIVLKSKNDVGYMD